MNATSQKKNKEKEQEHEIADISHKYNSNSSMRDSDIGEEDDLPKSQAELSNQSFNVENLDPVEEEEAKDDDN